MRIWNQVSETYLGRSIVGLRLNVLDVFVAWSKQRASEARMAEIGYKSSLSNSPSFSDSDVGGRGFFFVPFTCRSALAESGGPQKLMLGLAWVLVVAGAGVSDGQAVAKSQCNVEDIGKETNTKESG